MSRIIGFLAFIWFFCFFGTVASWSHDLNFTAVKVRFEKQDVTVSVVAHLHAFKAADPASEITRRLQLRLDGKPFSPTKTELIRDSANGIVIWQGQQNFPASPSPAEVALDAPIFPELPTQSTVLTVIHGNHVLDEAVVDASQPSAVIGKSSPPTRTLDVVASFVRQGIVHIIGGIDHVLFLLSLLLLGGSWRQLLKIVTAFTLAHSITLSLAATGVFSLPPRLVEPLIALSIVVVALGNLRANGSQGAAQNTHFRSLTAFAFGLLHGFGFAGALAEVGLPREALGLALLSFNGGVEIGQALLVLIFAPLLALLAKRSPKVEGVVVRYGSIALAIVGIVWCVQRIFIV